LPVPAEKIEGLEPPRAADAARLQPQSALPKTPTGARPGPPVGKIASPSPRLEPLPDPALHSQREPEQIAAPAVGAPLPAPVKTPPPPPETPATVEIPPGARRVVARKPATPAKELTDLLFGDSPPREPPSSDPGEVTRINEVELMARIRGYNNDLRRLEFKLAEPDRAWTARELTEALNEIRQLEEARGVVELYLPLVEKARRPHMGRPQSLEGVKRRLRARVERQRAELAGVAAATNRRWRLDVLDALLRQLANDGMTE
jgi:hypothetical protein